MAGSLLKSSIAKDMKNKKKGSDHWGRSLSRLDWDDKKEKTETQQLISSTIKEWYEAKHRGISEEEVKLMNTVEITKCRLCEASEIIRYGKYRSGIKRYYCNECHHSFSALTNTIFEDRKIKTAGAVIGGIAVIVMTVIGLINPPVYSTEIMGSNEEHAFDNTYQVSLADETYGDVKIIYIDSVEDYFVHADLKKAGKTVLVLESPSGEKKEFDLSIEKDTYEITQK